MPAGASPAVDKALKIKGRLGLKRLKRGELQGSRCRELRDACVIVRRLPGYSRCIASSEKKQRHKDQQRNRDYDIVQCSADVTNSVSYIAPWSSEWVLCMSHRGWGSKKAQRFRFSFTRSRVQGIWGFCRRSRCVSGGFGWPTSIGLSWSHSPRAPPHAPRAPGASDPSDPRRGKRLRRPQVMRRGHHAPRLR